jgi:hypothetical protein
LFSSDIPDNGIFTVNHFSLIFNGSYLFPAQSVLLMINGEKLSTFLSEDRIHAVVIQDP